jgi:hypothetical protein
MNPPETTASRIDDLMLNERGFVFDPNTGESYQVSTTGLACLRGMQHGETVANLLAHIISTQDVAPMQARSDLDAFIWDLKQLGWL